MAARRGAPPRPQLGSPHEASQLQPLSLAAAFSPLPPPSPPPLLAAPSAGWTPMPPASAVELAPLDHSQLAEARDTVEALLAVPKTASSPVLGALAELRTPHWANSGEMQKARPREPLPV